ncbi:MAG: dihydrolipoyl dehydrogenase [Spirochaetes bacterium]|nr:dihydrolipoyl dehydrogenase [Spirochaetota bacterium]
MTRSFDLAILGAGPGGYSAAIRARQLGLSVALIDPGLAGGVCLHEGCIPSKALLHAAKLRRMAMHEGALMGLGFAQPTVDVAALQNWKRGIVERLESGVSGLLKKHGVERFPHRGRLTHASGLELLNDKGEACDRLGFRNLILATGSREKRLAALGESPALWYPRDALAFGKVPERLAIIGAGIIGLELGQLFCRLGSEVHLYDALPELLPRRDRRLVASLKKSLEGEGMRFHLGARIDALEGQTLAFEEGGAKRREVFERVLSCVGRRPNSEGLGLERINIATDASGHVDVNVWLQTPLHHIFAIGDLVAGPQLAHRASRMGLLAAENATGRRYPWDVRGLPSVLYTDPELAWVGIGKAEAREKGLEVKIGAFPLAANGRAQTENATLGSMELVCDRVDGRVLGAEALGSQAEGLVSSVSLAMEMAGTAEDIAAAVWPHPSLFEALGESAEAVDHRAIHLFQESAARRPEA